MNPQTDDYKSTAPPLSYFSIVILVTNKGVEPLSNGRKPFVLTTRLIRHVMVLIIGLEPITFGISDHCSTIKLNEYNIIMDAEVGLEPTTFGL